MITRDVVGLLFPDGFNRGPTAVVGNGWTEGTPGNWGIDRGTNDYLAHTNNAIWDPTGVWRIVDPALPDPPYILQCNARNIEVGANPGAAYLFTEGVVAGDTEYQWGMEGGTRKFTLRRRNGGGTDWSEDGTAWVDNTWYGLRVIVTEAGGDVTLKGYATTALSGQDDLSEEFVLLESHTDLAALPPQAGTYYGFAAYDGVDFDNFFLFRSFNVVVSGLPTGYKVQIDSRTAVVETGGSVTVDASTYAMPATTLKVLDGDDNLIDSITPVDGVFMGDEYSYQAAEAFPEYPDDELPVTSGLQLWLSARSGDEQLVTDLSPYSVIFRRGASRDADAADPTYIAGPPEYYDLDGGDYFRTPADDYYHNDSLGNPHLYGDVVATGEPKTSVFFVVKPRTGQSQDYLHNAGVTNFFVILFAYVGNNFEWFFTGAAYTGDDPRTGAQLLADMDAWGTYCKTIGADGAGKQTGYKNGIEVYNLNKNFTVQSWGAAADELFIGSADQASNQWDGGIAQVLVFDRQLSEAEIIELHNYFADYYGIELVPEVPVNLSATKDGATAIDLDWDDVAGATSYKVYRESPIGGGFAYLDTVSGPSPVSAYTDSSVEDGTEYNYYVSTVINGDESYPSDADSAITDLKTPTNLVATTVDVDQIDLAWDNNADNATGYKVERESPIGGGFAEIDDIGDVGIYSDTPLESATEYNYRVKAYNAIAESAYSNEADATTESAEVGGSLIGIRNVGLSIRRARA